MKPTRPIKTFDKWFLHKVTMRVIDFENWNVSEWLMSQGIRSGKSEDYIQHHTFSKSPDRETYLYFENKEHADLLMAQFGGEYEAEDIGRGPRVNEQLSGNFTMEDLHDLFGDPLDKRVEFMLADYAKRSLSYFHQFDYMHHVHYGRKWWPAAFIYQGASVNGNYDVWWRERMRWLQANNITEFELCPCDMWEFGDANQAMMFKLAFGEDPLPK